MPSSAGKIFRRSGLPLKLNLGCGSDYRRGWLNVDPHAGGIADLSSSLVESDLPKNSFEEVLLRQVIEHLGYCGAFLSFAAIYRLLKEGGLIVIETPDIEASCAQFLTERDAARKEAILCWIYGTEDPGMGHRFCFPEECLASLLEKSGFVVEAVERNGGKMPVLTVRARKVGSRRLDMRSDILHRFSRQARVQVRYADHPHFASVIEAISAAALPRERDEIIAREGYISPKLVRFLLTCREIRSLLSPRQAERARKRLEKIARVDPFLFCETFAPTTYEKALKAYRVFVDSGRRLPRRRRRGCRFDFFTPAAFEGFLRFQRARQLKGGAGAAQR